MNEILYNYFTLVGSNLVETFKNPDAYLNKLALTVIILFISFLLYLITKNIIEKNIEDLGRRIKVYKVFRNTIVVVNILLVLLIWFKAINALVLSILIFGAFLIIMIRGIIPNIIGYFIIKHGNHFKVGHRLELEGIIGDVIDIGTFSFTLLECRKWLSSDSNTGRIIKIPNSIIFEQSIEKVGIENIFIWREIKYLISFDSNWQEAEKIMKAVGEAYYNELVVPELEKTSGYLGDDKKPVFALDNNELGIVLNLRYPVDYRNATNIKTSLQMEILTRFKAHKEINFLNSSVGIMTKEL